LDAFSHINFKEGVPYSIVVKDLDSKVIAGPIESYFNCKDTRDLKLLILRVRILKLIAEKDDCNIEVPYFDSKGNKVFRKVVFLEVESF
jgi:hypothetical protein